MFYSVLKLVQAEAERQMTGDKIGEQYRRALAALVLAIVNVARFN